MTVVDVRDSSQRPERLTILYGSESGNTENLAKQLSEDLERRGIDCDVETMNDFGIDKLQNGKHFLFLTSTAGQGEFPRNAKSFYESLSKLKEGSLSDIVYGVFGLGDHGYVNFNKAAKDLEKMLRVLGGNNLLAMGLGDDRDDEKYETKFYEWLPSLYKALHCEKVVKEVPPTPKYTATLSKTPQGTPKPFKPLRSHMLPLISTHRLTPEGYDRDIRQFTVDLTGTRVKYNVGDTLGIYPQNHAGDVEALLRDLSLNGDDFVKIQKSSQIQPLPPSRQHHHPHAVHGGAGRVRPPHAPVLQSVEPLRDGPQGEGGVGVPDDQRGRFAPQIPHRRNGHLRRCVAPFPLRETVTPVFVGNDSHHETAVLQHRLQPSHEPDRH